MHFAFVEKTGLALQTITFDHGCLADGLRIAPVVAIGIPAVPFPQVQWEHVLSVICIEMIVKVMVSCHRARQECHSLVEISTAASDHVITRACQNPFRAQPRHRVDKGVEVRDNNALLLSRLLIVREAYETGGITRSA